MQVDAKYATEPKICRKYALYAYAYFVQLYKSSTLTLASVQESVVVDFQHAPEAGVGRGDEVHMHLAVGCQSLKFKVISKLFASIV